MLHLVDKINYGEADDVLGIKTRDTLRACGVPCECHRIWATPLTRWLLHAPFRGRYWLATVLPVKWEWHKFMRQVRAGDVVWVCGSIAPKPETSCQFERAIQAKGARYVLHLIDNLFALPEMHAAILARAQLADAIVVVTPSLQAMVKEVVPNKPVVLLEEPVDTDRLHRPFAAQEPPQIIWTGRPRNIGHVAALAPVLEATYRSHAFTLRIVCGSHRPTLALNIPWEWMPYYPEKEGSYYQASRAGIAFFEDTPYNQCKGNYKVKTMLAAGVPVITTPVGYNHVLIKPGETGFLVRTPAEWAQSLKTLLTNAALAKAMGLAARQDMLQRYSHRMLMPVWRDALNKLSPAEKP